MDTSATSGYYWREYTGIIPDDAVPAGSDANNQPTYIGQAHLSDVGILPGTIYRGRKEIILAYCGLHTIQKNIKILCSSNISNFTWVLTTSESFHSQMIGKSVVIGGHENGFILNIGRIEYQGEVRTGKVHTSVDANMNAIMWIVYENGHPSFTKYEVLIYEPSIAPSVVPRVNYYWREYTGEIPIDAIPAGEDNNKRPTYIGQGNLINAGNIPGIIYEGRNDIAVPCNSMHRVTKNIKILCSPNLKTVKWIQASPSTFRWKLERMNPIIGGIEKDIVLYIGRVARYGALITGKVLTHTGDMYYDHNNIEEHYNGDYEVLVCDAQSSCHC